MSDITRLREKQARTAAFRGVQSLRGLAACMVVAHHATKLWSERTGNSPAWDNGAAGVDIFFVISGFVMAISSYGKEESKHPAWSFLERRFVRVLPLYWVVTLFLLLQVHVKSAVGFLPIKMTWQYIVSSFLLIPAHGAQGQVAPVLGVGWTLSFEMFFYVLFACALMLRIDLIRFLTPIMLGLAFIGLFHRDTWPAVSVLMNPLLLEFLAGVWIGRAVYQRTRIPSALSAVLGMAGLVTIMVVPQGDFPGSRVLGWGICSVLIVQAAVMLEDSFGEWLPGWVLRVGDASYSLYLIHLLVLSKVAWALLRLRVLTPGVVSRREEMIMIVLCLLCTVPAAFVCYRWVELPLNGFLQRKMGLRKVQVQ